MLRDFRHPVTVLTKGALIARDADILGAMGRRGSARGRAVGDDARPRLARAMEPRAAAPERRLQAMATLAAAGCPVRVSIGPVIPGLNDHEIEKLLAAARDAGASAASYVVLRMPLEVKAHLRRLAGRGAIPTAPRRVMGLVRELHGGRDYDPRWGKRMKGEGVMARLIARRFASAAARLGLAKGPAGAAPRPVPRPGGQARNNCRFSERNDLPRAAQG